MTLQEILKKYLDDDTKVQSVLNDMKENKIYTASEENMDIRYQSLQEKYNTKEKEHQTAQELIEDLKKNNGESEETKNKISEYETTISNLEAKVEELQIQSALRVDLLSAKVTDTDYIAYKINENLKAENKKLELDDNGHIKNFDSIVEAQKKSNPSFFASEEKKEVVVKDLGNSNHNQDQKSEPKNLLEALTDHYTEKTDI